MAVEFLTLPNSIYTKAKDSNSNIYKLMQVFKEEMQELEDVYTQIRNMADIDQSYGAALRQQAINVGETPRYDLDEVTFRRLVKSKIASNLSPADTNSMINYFSNVFGIDAALISIKEPAAKTILVEINAPVAQSLADEIVIRLKAGGIIVQIITSGVPDYRVVNISGAKISGQKSLIRNNYPDFTIYKNQPVSGAKVSGQKSIKKNKTII
jgi:hypothetical protein